MRRCVNAALTVALLLSACASPLIRSVRADPLDVSSDKPFLEWFKTLTSQAAADPNYRRIPLDTHDQSQEFIYLLHEAYSKQVTGDQFAQMVNLRYPGHEYEVSFILQHLPR
jgi:hypothetical protein